MTLSPVEARVLYFVLRGEWAPAVGYEEFMSAVGKLKALAGGERCRDCTGIGTIKSHLGGWVCEQHKPDIEAEFRRATTY